MASLKTLKTRIKSVNSTKKITKAMKVVSAAKLKKSRDRLENTLPYYKTLNYIINNVYDAVDFSDIESKTRLYMEGSNNNKILLIVAASDRGLCGSFNTNILKVAKKVINDYYSLGKEVPLILMGNKAIEWAERNYSNLIIKTVYDITKTINNVESVDGIVNFIDDKINNVGFENVFMIHGHFKSIISTETVVKQLLPFQKEEIEDFKLENKQSNYEYEPAATSMINSLILQKLKAQMYYFVLDSVTGEHSSRMTAMDNATRNASDMINKLSLIYNRSRQSMITKELIEIISGSEAI